VISLLSKNLSHPVPALLRYLNAQHVFVRHVSYLMDGIFCDFYYLTLPILYIFFDSFVNGGIGTLTRPTPHPGTHLCRAPGAGMCRDGRSHSLRSWDRCSHWIARSPDPSPIPDIMAGTSYCRKKCYLKYVRKTA